MILVLCMAGTYSRFRSAGYTTPKFLLPWLGTTIFEHILATMLEGGSFRRVLCIANQRDAEHADTIRRVLENCPVPARAHFVPDTLGQAHTAAIACEGLLAENRGDEWGDEWRDEPVVFHNIDTILLDRNYAAIAAELHDCRGFIDTFDADSDKYSYVAVDPTGRVTAIAEKKAISRQATSGLYGFSSARGYFAAYERAFAHAGNSERYISAVYAGMIEAGDVVRAGGPLDRAKTIILGTPEEYEAARSQNQTSGVAE